jgi:hypothetical protein
VQVGEEGGRKKRKLSSRDSTPGKRSKLTNITSPDAGRKSY